MPVILIIPHSYEMDTVKYANYYEATIKVPLMQYEPAIMVCTSALSSSEGDVVRSDSGGKHWRMARERWISCAIWKGPSITACGSGGSTPRAACVEGVCSLPVI